MSSLDKEWADLEVTHEELNRLTDAMKNDEFKKLFFEYCEEIQDPENRKIYEKELTQLEAQRGVDITFLHPTPGFVVKTSVDGKIKGFINIASSEHIDKPKNEIQLNEKTGKKGVHWSLPYAQAPPRHDIDNRKEKCYVYDVLFNPEALRLVEKNKVLKEHLIATALDAVEREYKVKLDRTNLKFPKMKFKGIPRATITRKIAAVQPENVDNEDPFAGYMPPKPTNDENSKPKVYQFDTKKPDDYATPKYTIKHRRGIDLAEMTDELDAKINLTIPKEIVVEIELPLLKSTSDCTLDVNMKRLYLISEKPAKYQLGIDLPFNVDDQSGSAKFDIKTRKLSVTLPVSIIDHHKKLKDLNREDSGVESDVRDEHSIGSPSRSDSPPLIEELETKLEDELTISDEEQLKKFLDENIKYYMPDFNCNALDDNLVYVLQVKNVDPQSIEHVKSDKSFHMKFVSIGAGYYPVHYAFYCQLDEKSEATIADINAEAWDNNVIVTLTLNNYEHLNLYSAGLNENSTKPMEILPSHKDYYDLLKEEDKETANENFNIKVNRLNEENQIEFTITKLDDDDDDASEKKEKGEKTVKDDCKKPVTLATSKKSKKKNKKRRSYSESACDDLKILSESINATIEEQKKIQNEQTEPSSNDDVVENVRKMRSFSESRSGVDCNNPTFKGILKHYSRYGRTMSGGSFSSMDEYSCSIDGIGQADSFDDIPEEDAITTTDGNVLSRSCKKTVRFNSAIQKQLFRLDSSILGQKKRNQKKKNQKQRALLRRNSEGDSTDYINDKTLVQKKPANHDSGMNLCDSELLDNNETKNNLMFDIEM